MIRLTLGLVRLAPPSTRWSGLRCTAREHLSDPRSRWSQDQLSARLAARDALEAHVGHARREFGKRPRLTCLSRAFYSPPSYPALADAGARLYHLQYAQ